MASIISPGVREFTWSRDPEGYVLSDDWQKIVPGSRTLVSYNPLENENLFGQFASIRPIASGVLPFVNEFGLLTLEGVRSAEGEQTGPILEAAETIRQLLMANAQRRMPSALPSRPGNVHLEVRMEVRILDPASHKHPFALLRRNPFSH
jgi:hypothetical protein